MAWVCGLSQGDVRRDWSFYCFPTRLFTAAALTGLSGVKISACNMHMSTTPA